MKTEDIENSLTMEEILKTIRIMVSENMEEEKKEEILELTDIVEIGDKAKLKNNDPKDVFDKIDQVIGAPIEQKTTTPPVAEKSETSPNLPKAEKILQDDEALNEEISPPKNLSSTTSEKGEKTEKEENLISNETLQASAAALKAFLHEDKEDNSTDQAINHYLESLVKKLLKIEISKWFEGNLPLLKSELSKWLDDNLPSLVQTIIEKEIKKIIPPSKKN